MNKHIIGSIGIIVLLVMTYGAYLFTTSDKTPIDTPHPDFEEIPTSEELLLPETVSEVPPLPTSIVPNETGIQGQVTLGPTCPVMREGDNSCTDKPYQTTVQIIEIGSPNSAPFATAETASDGTFFVELPPGKYAVQPIGGTPLPSCNTQEITVEEGVYSTVDLSCDSGIR
jgi:hypothetical protein